MSQRTSTSQAASVISLIARAEHHRERTAVTDPRGSYTYGQLLEISARVAAQLLGGRADLEEARVAFLVAPGFPWVAVQWGVWRAGGIAVPLPMGSPAAELEYFIDDTQSAVLLFDSDAEKLLAPLADARRIRALSFDEILAGNDPARLPQVDTRRRAMILYTSGTTSRPKGVVSTHGNVEAQITTLVNAWEWRGDDRIVLCLPLHHVHGIINVLSCALWAGATCDLLPRFDATAVWEQLSSGKLTLFMAVPTIYVRLIAAWEAMPPEQRKKAVEACKHLRLMVSGSAALPVTTLEQWRNISGHVLLERYGMTEIGMALSNPLHGTRVPGSVGTPLPGVELRLVDEHAQPVAPDSPGKTSPGESPSGEIEVRGPSVFKEYWGKPQATREAFRDGWFRTGDMATVENGVYRILGRTSIDIIKTGGHKVSALELEEVLRAHPAVAECAVVGMPDEEWGERVCAALVLHAGNVLDLAELRSWARERLAVYKIPSLLLLLDALPRNAMGKVTKPAVAAAFRGSGTQG